jgi:hypothetical protein
MLVTLCLILISALILILYFGALLVFTPDDKEDKYIKRFLERGFILYDSPSGKFLTAIKKYLGYALIVFLYTVLQFRHKID